VFIIFSSLTSNLITDTSASDLVNVCKKYGRVKQVITPVDPKANRRKGFGFVVFDVETSAEEAISNLDNCMLNEKVLKVEFAKADNRKRRSDDASRYVSMVDKENYLRSLLGQDCDNSVENDRFTKRLKRGKSITSHLFFIKIIELLSVIYLLTSTQQMMPMILCIPLSTFCMTRMR
jgi:RNA recognition motif-containing protein